MTRDRRRIVRIFAVPLLVFSVSLAGLLWALLAEGRTDRLAGLAAGVSLAVIGWALARRRR